MLSLSAFFAGEMAVVLFAVGVDSSAIAEERVDFAVIS